MRERVSEREREVRGGNWLGGGGGGCQTAQRCKVIII